MSNTSPLNTLKKNPWYTLEILLGVCVLVYFLTYPRDTISDFVVCTPLCLLILRFGKKVGLFKPQQSNFSSIDIFLFTGTTIIYFFAWYYANQQQKINEARFIESFQVTLLYIYYAWFQHFLAQRYTALRMKLLAEKFSGLKNLSLELKAAVLTGIVFGILHIPYPSLMLPAAIGGSFYAYYFLKTGRLWAVVLSHAFIASTWIYWGLDSNAFEEFTFLFK